MVGNLSARSCSDLFALRLDQINVLQDNTMPSDATIFSSDADREGLHRLRDFQVGENVEWSWSCVPHRLVLTSCYMANYLLLEMYKSLFHDKSENIV